MSQVKELTRLAAILSRLDSDFAGERAAAGLLASREVRKLGLTWVEVVAPARLPPPASGLAAETHWRDVIGRCQQHDDELTDWEADFLASLSGFSRITGKQQAMLEKIAARLRVGR